MVSCLSHTLAMVFGTILTMKAESRAVYIVIAYNTQRRTQALRRRKHSAVHDIIALNLTFHNMRYNLYIPYCVIFMEVFIILYEINLVKSISIEIVCFI